MANKFSDKLKDEIWILADDRVGTFSQSIGLAEEMKLEYRIITLNYSFLATLPNCILGQSFFRLDFGSRKKIKELNYLPKIIISAGRKSAPIALYLKKLSGKRSKVIQIMNPNLNFEKFDFVILPEHDKVNPTKFPNLINTIGSLTKINDQNIQAECEKFSPWFQNIEKTKIALFIGGSSKKTEFDEKSAEKLAHLVSRIARNMNATLLITNSRRTGDELSKKIESNLNCDFKFFDCKNQNNPYLAIIGYADFFIVSGDSVSMISECASTGKPLYIFDEKNISSAKHHNFHQSLYHNNYAKKLTKNSESLDKFSAAKLQESKRVAEIIMRQIFDNS